MTEKLSFVTICIVTWNSTPVLRPCLESLKSQEYSNFQMVVVDNASHDESLELVWSHFPEAVVIKNNVNAGFCRAHNQAIHLSQGEFYLALNPDVIMAPDFLSQLVAAITSSPDYGMAGGKLLLKNNDGKQNLIDSSGYFLDRRRRQYLRGYGKVDEGQYDQEGDVFGIDGAAPLYRRTMLEDVCIQGEYFDEAFFAHKEDIDLAWRSRILGWKAIYNPQAVAMHVHTFRPGKRAGIDAEIRRHAVKNRYFLMLKNEAKCTWRRDWPGILWYDLKILAYLLVREWSSLKAFSVVWQNRRRIRYWRKAIWSKAKVSDEEMLGWFKDLD